MTRKISTFSCSTFKVAFKVYLLFKSMEIELPHFLKSFLLQVMPEVTASPLKTLPLGLPLGSI